jgi:hypothetical protein
VTRARRERTDEGRPLPAKPQAATRVLHAVRPCLLLPVMAALAACRSPGSSPVPEARADEPTRAVAPAGVAVVELFTSEGCSSCPPADAVLARVASRPGVFALSFHVDYWDDLGWPDRFATAENTARQQAYARSLGARGLYTPQLVVGGADAFVGSDSGHADASIARSLASAPSVRLTLHVRTTPTEALVDYQTEGAPPGAVIDVALVERWATTDVRAGENAGRTLHHANVVRSFISSALVSPSGTIALRLPPVSPGGGADVIGYVQRPPGEGNGMPVLGAASAHLDSHE